MYKLITLIMIFFVSLMMLTCGEKKETLKDQISTFNCADSANSATKILTAYEYLKYIDTEFKDRNNDSQNLLDFEDFIKKELCSFRYDPLIFENVYKYRKSDDTGIARNIVAIKEGQTDEIVLIGGHYDKYGIGSHGIVDNGTGVATILNLARYFANAPKPYHTLYFVFWDAEENGVNGSREFVRFMDKDIEKFVAVINLDTVAGGDFIYANAPKTAVDRKAYPKANTTTKIRDIFYQRSQELNYEFHLTPPAPDLDLQAGEKGDFGDYVPFYRAGVPIVDIETTNANLLASSGYKDGYSQVENLAFWRNSRKGDCANYPENAVIEGGPSGDKNFAITYPRTCEEGWGEIWHGSFDTLDNVEMYFPGRLQNQMNAVYETVLSILKDTRILQ